MYQMLFWHQSDQSDFNLNFKLFLRYHSVGYSFDKGRFFYYAKNHLQHIFFYC